MIARNIWTGVMLMGLAVSLFVGNAQAVLILSDDFEAQALGAGPDATKWTSVYGGTPTSMTITNDVDAAQGSKSLKIVGQNALKNIGIDTKLTTSYTTIYVSAWVRIDTDTTATNGAAIDCMSSSSVYAGLRFVPKGAGTGLYDVKVVSNTTNPPSSPNVIKWDVVAASLPIGVWEKWVFGVQVTNSGNGDGVYTVYRNGVKLADNVPVHPYSANTLNVTKVRFWGDHNSWHLDDAQVYDNVIGGTLPGTLAGQVTLSDYTGSRELTPVSILVSQGGSPVKTLTANLDAAGNYSIATGLAAGTYDLNFKACCWLSKTVTGVVFSSSAPPDPVSVTLNNGDSDGDNEVTSSDLSLTVQNMDVTGD